MDPYGPVWVPMVPEDSLGASWGLLEPILGHLGFNLNLLGPPGAHFGLPELISGFLKHSRVHFGPPAPGSYERSRAQAAPERDGQTAREDKGDGAPRGSYCPRLAHEAKSNKQRYLTDACKTAGRKLSPKSLEAKTRSNGTIRMSDG